MNFLGHLSLSGQVPLVIVGNFMADAVKGRELSRFHPLLARGIRLHRAIDSFTDAHPLQRLGRQRVHGHAGRYASVVMDMFYDHILASNWNDFHPGPLSDFTAHMYDLLQRHVHLMPERTRSMLPYMVQGDWLTSYATLEGLGRALSGLARRVPEGASMIGSERVLDAHMATYVAEFKDFLPDLKQHVTPLQ